MNSIERLY